MGRISSREYMALIPNSTNLSECFAGNQASVFLKKRSFQVYATGRNDDGGLGIGDTITKTSVTLVSKVLGIFKLASYFPNHLMLHRSGSSVYSLSRNIGFDVYKPIPAFDFGYDSIKTQSSSSHTIITTTNAYYIFGSNSNGELGLGNTNSVSSFQLVKTNFTIIDISPGNRFTMFLSKERDVYGVGANSFGQLALNSQTSTIQITKSPFFSNIEKLKASTKYSVFSNTTNIYVTGGLGAGFLIPYSYTFNSTVIDYYVTDDYFTILLENKQIYVLGSNSGNILGFNGPNYVDPGILPYTLVYNITMISSGGNSHTYFLTNESKVLVIGPAVSSFYGQTETPDPLLRYISIENVTKVFAGPFNGFFMDKDQRFLVIGKNNLGGLGIGNIDNQNKSIPNGLLSVIDASSTDGNSYFINYCSETYGGPLCNEPICFGRVASDQDACAGQGRCISPNVCQCYPPSYGDQCDNIDDYFWYSPTDGEWGDSNFWGVKRFDEIEQSTLVPGKKAEKVTFNHPFSTITVRITDQDLVLDEVYIEENTNVRFIVTGKSLKINKLLKLNSQSSLDIFSSNFTVPNLIVPSLSLVGSSAIIKTLSISNGLVMTNSQLETDSLALKSVSLIGSTLKMKILSVANGLDAVNSQLEMDSLSLRSLFLSGSNGKIKSLIVSENSDVINTQLESNTASFKTITMRNLIISSKEMNATSDVISFSSTINNAKVKFFKTLNIYGPFNLNQASLELSQNVIFSSSGSSLVTSSNITLLSTASWNQTMGSLTSTSDSVFLNLGVVSLKSYNSDNRFVIPLINYNVIEISGPFKTHLHPYFNQLQTGRFTLNNSYIVSSGELNFNKGLYFLSGIIETSLLNISTSDGFIRFLSPNTLNIIGNASFEESTTLFLEAKGTDINMNDRLNVTGILSINSFVILKLSTDYSPRIGQKIGFLNYGQIRNRVQNIYLFGAPFKGASYDFNNGVGYFEVTLSFGNVQNTGYKCHYLGKRKVLEMNEYTQQKKVMLSLTIPKVDSAQKGFGFDINGSISNSILGLAMGSTVTQFKHSFNSTLNYLSGQATESQSIFEVGPLYYTITLLVPRDYLVSQNYIYYSEILNQTNQINITNHYFERFEYKVLSPDFIDCTNFLQPTRAETYNIPVLSVLLFAYIVLFILCLLFSRFKPLNARGISPFLTLIFLILQLALETRNYTLIPEFQGTLCVFLGYGIYPFQAICFFVNYFYFLKYFSIINLNENKKNIYQQIKLGKSIEKFQIFKNTFLKILSSRTFSWVLITLCYLSFIVLNTIILASYRYVCRFQTLVILKIIQNIILIFVYLFTIITFITDIIPNLGLLFVKCQWIGFIFFMDPYFFRVQALIYFPLMVYSLVIEILSLSLSPDFLGIVKYHTVFIGLNTSIYILLLIIIVIFPLSISILNFFIYIYYIITKRNVEKKGFFEEITTELELLNIFIKFCEKEFTSENILCYLDIQEYKRKKIKAQDIFTKYLNGSASVMEINVKKVMCDKIWDKISSKEELDVELFSEIEKEVKMNMVRNSVVNFQTSKEYQKYLDTKRKEEKMIEGKKK